MGLCARCHTLVGIISNSKFKGKICKPCNALIGSYNVPY